MKLYPHLILVVPLVACAASLRAESFEWIQQVSGPGSGSVASEGISADEFGNVYICGSAGFDLGGPSAGDNDAFVRKYDSAGNVLWTRQFGTIGIDGSRSVSAAEFGYVYVAGFTSGSLSRSNAGSADAFVRNY